MASVTLSTRYRPARIGFCVRQNDLSAALSAIDMAHSIWGGRFCPIIPCDDAKQAGALIDAFGVDTLYPVTNDNLIDAVISNCKPLAWPFLDRGFFRNDGVRHRPQFVSVSHPILKLKERRDSPTQYPTIVKILWEEDDPLGAWFCALIGRYQNNDNTKQFGKEFDTLWPKQIKLSKDSPVPADLMHQITPNRVTGLDLHLSRRRDRAIYVAGGDLFRDIVSFWNLRATGEWLAFYDRTVGGRLEQFLSRFQAFDNEERAAETTSPVRIYANDKTALRDSPFSESPFQEVDAFISHFAFALPMVVARTRSVLGNMDGEQPPSIYFGLPEKPCFETIDFHDEHLILEVTSFGNMIRQTDYIFPPPPVPALNEFYGRKLWYLREAVRAMPKGIAFFVSATDENFHVCGVETYAIIQQLFELAGIRVTRSRPGLIARQLIQQLGDLQGCRVFKIPGVRALIEKYGPIESFVRSEAIQMIRDLDFASHESLYVGKRAHKSLTPEDVFGFLLDREVFRAGLELECPNCQLPFWKHIDDCITKLPCEYCGKVFNITPQLRHRGDWRFRRSGLFGASNHQEGSVPVLLTLQQIETSIHDYPLTCTTALKLEGEGINCESDFVVIHSDYRGNVEIVLSECKTRDEISQGDIDNLSAVAEKLSAVGLKVFLLFSKTAVFTQDEIDRCKRIKSRASGGTILLSARELEPYFMYERASKEFHVETHGVSFDDMADATRCIYLEPRPKTTG